MPALYIALRIALVTAFALLLTAPGALAKSKVTKCTSYTTIGGTTHTTCTTRR